MCYRAGDLLEAKSKLEQTSWIRKRKQKQWKLSPDMRATPDHRRCRLRYCPLASLSSRTTCVSTNMMNHLVGDYLSWLVTVVACSPISVATTISAIWCSHT